MKVLVYFLPQFYVTPENEKYWGTGFTDWVNVKSAQPLFNGHKQPISPIRNNYYDLSKLKTLQAHSDLSVKYGIDGFGYWHYWFGNDFMTLEKVQEMHLKNKSIKQNFFFAWANTDWTKSWKGDDNVIIFKQEYSKQSAVGHFNYLQPYFADIRYIKKNNKPLFQVLNPNSPGAIEHIRYLEKMAVKYFKSGIHWLFPGTVNTKNLEGLSYSIVGFPPGDITANINIVKFKRKLQKIGLINRPVVIPQELYISTQKKILSNAFKANHSYYPCLLSGWDNTPRYKRKGFLIKGDIPVMLEEQFLTLKQVMKKNKINDLDFIFIKAWNEWAEGNILEHFQYKERTFYPLEVVKNMKKSWNNG